MLLLTRRWANALGGGFLAGWFLFLFGNNRGKWAHCQRGSERKDAPMKNEPK